MGDDIMLKDIIFEAMKFDKEWTVTAMFERLMITNPNLTRPDVFSAMQDMAFSGLLIKDAKGKDSLYTLTDYENLKCTLPSYHDIKHNIDEIHFPNEIEIPAEFNRHEEALKQIRLRKKDKEMATAHYRFVYKSVKIDPYRIFRIYEIYAPEQQHAIKKLLRAGKSVKPLEQDIKEVIMTLERWLEIINEDREIL